MHHTSRGSRALPQPALLPKCKKRPPCVLLHPRPHREAPNPTPTHSYAIIDVFKPAVCHPTFLTPLLLGHPPTHTATHAPTHFHQPTHTHSTRHSPSYCSYAFINMVKPEYIIPLVDEFHSKRWPKFNSEKICNIAYGRIQVGW